MNKSRPRRVKVGAHWYRIQYLPEDKVEGRYVGLCFHTTKLIKIAGALSERMVAQTLLHEVMHAIYYEWGMVHSELPAKDYAAGMCPEEVAVNGLSQGLSTVLVDNPPVLAFFTRAFKP